MWLVLCHANDRHALWAYEQLVAHGLAPVELITAEVLACALRCKHRLNTNTDLVNILLPDGRRIDNSKVRGTLNRIHYPALQHLSVATESERDYAAQEIQAFYLGWLHALPQPLLNSPSPQGLSGQWRFPTEWNMLASRAGLATHPIHISSRDSEVGNTTPEVSPQPHQSHRTIFYVAGDIVGSLVPAETASACRRLGRMSGAELLGMEFAVEDHWIFLNASASPNLSMGGRPLIESIVNLFTKQTTCCESSAQ